MPSDVHLPAALRELGDALRAAELTLAVPGRDEAAAAAGASWSTRSTTTCSRGCEQMDAPAADGRRRLDRRRQVDARQQPRRRGRQPRRRAAPDDACAGARLPSRRPRAGSRTTGSCPGCARTTGGASGRGGLAAARAHDRAAARARAARLARHRLGRGGQPRARAPAARRGRRVAVRDDRRALRRRRAVGAPAAPRASAAPRSSLVLDRVPPEAVRGGRRRTCARCSPSAASPTRSCSSCPEIRLDDGRLPRRRARARARAGSTRSPPTRRRAPARAAHARPARCDSLPAARRGGRRRAAPSSSDRRGRAARRRGARRTRAASTRSTRRCAAARSCAARCSRAGTR